MSTGGVVPVQQSTGALIETVPPSGSFALPQMVPAGEQPVPSVQRLVEESQLTVPLGAPPQQDEVTTQKLPVSRHPVAGPHTVAPLPRSTQVREQHDSPCEQGFPSCRQPPLAPPVTNRQKPEPPSSTEQAFPQQSALLPQTSPFAWQR